jgi:hypothetical protein
MKILGMDFPDSDRATRSVWSAVASAPLFDRTKIKRFFEAFARSKARLKPAQSRRFATWHAGWLLKTRPEF